MPERTCLSKRVSSTSVNSYRTYLLMRRNKLPQRLKRVPPRHNLCTTNDAKAIQHLKGANVVWSYERIRKNYDAQSIPLVDVVFRALDDLDVPDEISVIPIGIARLASFRLGTIWKDGECIAEHDFGEDQEFTVNFTAGTFSHVSVVAKAGHPSLHADPVPGSAQRAPTLTDFLSFPLPEDKTLLIPCIEFLVRCYGSTPDIARTLATHDWDNVKSELYACAEVDPEIWLVRPAKHIHDDDALLLASMLYDPYAQNAAKEIYSTLDNALGAEMREVSLQVRPWFQGPATVRARGRWLEGGDTFVCCEVTGLSEPLSNAYEIRRVNYSREDPQGKVVTDINRIDVEIPKPQDPYEVTDLEEPDRNGAEWAKPDPSFETIGPKCRFTRSIEERSYSERRVVKHNPTTPTVVSTGDKVNSGTGVKKVRHVARRVPGDGGVLNAIWTELRRLRHAQSDFSLLEWYSGKAFDEGSSFRLLSLPGFHDEDNPGDKARRWLAHKDNATGVRGMLVIHAVINNRSFYILETQRKKKRINEVYEEETSFGLLMEIHDPALALKEISRICDKIRFCIGKFLELEDLDPDFKHWAFRHIHRGGLFEANATLRAAFAKMNIKLSRSEQKPKPPKSGSTE